MNITLYHNPACSKSRQTLALLQAENIKLDIVEYLHTPPSHQQLDSLLRGLNMQPRGLMRSGEAVYKQLALAEQNLSRDQLIEIMIENPVLIQRPILVAGDEVAIGRPPEAVLEILHNLGNKS